jgi:hypothetical protein
VERDAVGEAVLAQLDGDQAGGEAGGPDRREVQLRQDVGQRADVVLVPVGNDDAPDAVELVPQVGHVGDHEVDAEHLVLGEHHAGVDGDDVVAGLDHHHVAADLAEAAERDAAEVRIHGFIYTEPARAGGRGFGAADVRLSCCWRPDD